MDAVRHRPTAPSLGRVTAALATCADLLAHLEPVPAAQLAVLVGQLAALQQLVTARLMGNLLDPAAVEAPDGDRLLTVAEVADRLACSKDWVYRHRLPFAVRQGRQRRFSAKGLEHYIRDRAGRETTSLSARTER
jgi:excisionase family DNA binding protein